MAPYLGVGSQACGDSAWEMEGGWTESSSSNSAWNISTPNEVPLSTVTKLLLSCVFEVSFTGNNNNSPISQWKPNISWYFLNSRMALSMQHYITELFSDRVAVANVLTEFNLNLDQKTQLYLTKVTLFANVGRCNSGIKPLLDSSAILPPRGQ